MTYPTRQLCDLSDDELSMLAEQMPIGAYVAEVMRRSAGKDTAAPERLRHDHEAQRRAAEAAMPHSGEPEVTNTLTAAQSAALAPFAPALVVARKIQAQAAAENPKAGFPLIELGFQNPGDEELRAEIHTHNLEELLRAFAPSEPNPLVEAFASPASASPYAGIDTCRMTAAPDDRVSVPREPTWEMQIAGRDAILSEDDSLDLSTDDARACFQAMLAAAPPPPVADGRGEEDWRDATPPEPASPDERLVAELRERARAAREERTATALGDARHFEQAADELAYLHAGWSGMAAKLSEARAESERLRANHGITGLIGPGAMLSPAKKEG